MWSKCWPGSARVKRRSRGVAEKRRVAFLGIGHPLRRDDAAGVEVCRRMAAALAGRDDVLVVAGGPAPENCVGALRAFAPQMVIVIDAARMGQPPGTLLRIDPSDPRLAGASTHTLPLPAFCEYVEATLGCDMTLLGIEPADTSFGEGLTPVVERAVEQFAKDALAHLAAGRGVHSLIPSRGRHSRESRFASRRGGGNPGSQKPGPPPARGRQDFEGAPSPWAAGQRFSPPSSACHSRESGNPGRQEPGPPLPLRDPLRDAKRDPERQRDECAKRDPRGRQDFEGAPSPWAARQRFSPPSCACHSRESGNPESQEAGSPPPPGRQDFEEGSSPRPATLPASSPRFQAPSRRLGVGGRRIFARKHTLSGPMGSAVGRFRGREKERSR